MIKTKYKAFIIDLVIYPFDVMCYFGEDREPLYEMLSDHNVAEGLIKEFKKLDFSLDGHCYDFKEGKQTLIYIKNLPQSPWGFGILQHEIFHAVNVVLDRIGMSLEYSSEEAYAYLVSYLTEQIYKKLENGIITTT